MARLAARGLSNRAIAEQLFLSPRTVASHLYRIFPKLSISTRAQLRDIAELSDRARLDGVYGVWGWRGLTAYFAGFLAEIPFMMLPSIGGFTYTGYVPGHLTNGVDYSWLVGLMVSGLVYWLLSRSLDVTGEQAAIDASERELRAIDDVVAETDSA